MTQLCLRLDDPHITPSLPYGAIGRIRWISDASGRQPEQRWSHEQPIVVGAQGYSTIDLPAGGRFSVDVVPPRGEMISTEVFVDDGAVHEEKIAFGAVTDKDLSWQQFAGIVPARSDADRRRAGRIRPEVSALWRGVAGTGAVGAAIWSPLAISHGFSPYLIAPLLPALLGAEWAGASLFARLRATREWAGISWARIPLSAEAWDNVAELARDRRSRRLRFDLRGVVHHVPRDSFALSEDDGRYVTWGLDALKGPELERRFSWERGYSDGIEEPSRWAFIEVKKSLHLVSIPWAWWLSRKDPPTQPAPIRIVHDRHPSVTGSDVQGRTTISVLDERWFPMLEFLASGRLIAAGAMAEDVLRPEDPSNALEGKLKGPLLAVAGGILLLARTKSPDRQDWDQWLENLANWFPRIPDGKILLGCRRLQQACGRDELAEAFAYLKDGFERGVPYFTATIQMLSVALAQLANDFAQAEKLRERVSPVAARVDSDQCFTVIRL